MRFFGSNSSTPPTSVDSGKVFFQKHDPKGPKMTHAPDRQNGFFFPQNRTQKYSKVRKSTHAFALLPNRESKPKCHVTFFLKTCHKRSQKVTKGHMATMLSHLFSLA